MADTITFTEARVRTLRDAATGGNRIEYQDGKVPALRLRISATSASWSVLKRIPGGPMRRVQLGSADELPVELARKRAQQVVAAMLDGRDLTKEKRRRSAEAQRASITLSEGLAIYLAEKDGLRPATRATYERDLRTTFGDWWDRPLAEMTPEWVRDRHRNRKTRPITSQARVSHARDKARITASPARADGAVRALRAVVNYLRAERDLDLPDVAKRIVATKGWGNVPRRKRALLGQALAEFVQSIRALPDDLPPDLSGTQRDVVLLILCTGLRWASAAGLRWDEVDFKAKTITIPADRMKGKVSHSLPLGPAMMAMLEQRAKKPRSSVLVFPGLNPEQDEPAEKRKPDKPIGRLSKRFLAKIADADGNPITWSPHDLRRTALTLLEAMDVSAYALKRIAAHAQSGDVTAGYLADDVERLRVPMERLENAALALPRTGNVVPMRGAS